ncbi:MAG: sodium:proton antiporter NhaD, partial [Gammaproteobacteria bacterium]
MDFTDHWAGIVSVLIFVSAYSLVIAEESLHLRKSKPVMVAAGIIWTIVAIVYAQAGDTHAAEQAMRHNLLEFAELFLFLLAAMTFINTMEERGIFDALRIWLVTKGFSLRTIYWLTGLLAFFISPVADNLTTALLMATVAMAVGGTNTRFVAVACINIVVAANAGGAFSPFGDITTLMVWQKGMVHFQEFFALFLPSVVNWLVPAAIMSMVVPGEKPAAVESGDFRIRHGGWVVVGLFVLTIAMAVSAHNFLHMPPVLGMMTGLGLLKFYGYYLKRRDATKLVEIERGLGEAELNMEETQTGSRAPTDEHGHGKGHYNIFKSLERAEWDTL